MDLKKLLFILITCYSFSVVGKPAPFKKIKEFRSELKNLEKDIEKLDVTLGKKNQKYIELIEKRKFLELKSREFSLEILERAQLLKGEITKIKKLLAKSLIQSFNDNEEAGDMLARIVLRKHFEKKLSKYQNNLASIVDLQEKSKFLKTKIEEYYGIETSLLAIIEDLERKKYEGVSDYREKSSQIKKLNKKLLKLKRKKPKIISKNALILKKNFKLPLENYTSIKKSRKGIDIKFKGNKPIKATKKGKVSYLGNLSTFGNVLMLDHGNETRSVIFGPFKSSLKKGDPVKAGQIIGQTQGNGTKLNVINFGIWYKNKAQDTSTLFSKKRI